MAVKPKLALIPSGIRNGKIYSVLPSNGDGDFTFTRGSSATKLNKDGLIELVDADVPRLNYPTNGDCPSLLLEPSRLNYIVGSNHFQDWTTGGTVNRNADFGISPDGTQNSVNVNFSNFGIIYRSPNRPQSDYVFSVFAKKVDGTDSLLTLRLDTPTAKIGIFNLETGSKVVNTSDEASIEYYGNGWYRCSITVYDYEVINAVIGEGQNSLNCELYGAMLEEGTYLTSYVKTPQNSTASRSYDFVNTLGSLQSNSILGTDTGTWFIDFKDMFFEITGTGVGSMYLWLNSSEQIEFLPNGNKEYKISLNNSTAYTGITNNDKVAISWDKDGIVIYVNGVFGYASSTAVYSVPYDFLYLSNSARQHRVDINSLKLYDKRLSNADLITLTTND